MVTESWEQASKSRGGEIQHMKKLIPYYSYEDQSKAVMTDRKLCEVLRSDLIKSKVFFSDAVDWMYKNKTDSRHFERLKDDFDILLDEIEIKQNTWDERIPQEFLERVIVYDWNLMQKAWQLEQDLDILIKYLQKSVEKSEEEKLPDKIRISIDVVHEKVDSITKMFKEREVAFEINNLSMRETFNRFRRKIRKSV
ncbi:MAG: hypothetical protein KAT15_08835 [Bacteroidales bacterium]|nr:hypothetical protein [Bacteroidales bacterium]